MIKHKKTRKLKRKTRKQRGGAFTVRFGGKVANGTVFPSTLTKRAPEIIYRSPGLYTLIMWDPDALAKSWLHWLVINAEEGDVKHGEEIMKYAPPTPPSGTHRYFVTLYSQGGPLILQEIPTERGYFNVDTFVQENNLVKVGEAMVQANA